MITFNIQHQVWTKFNVLTTNETSEFHAPKPNASSHVSSAYAAASFHEFNDEASIYAAKLIHAFSKSHEHVPKSLNEYVSSTNDEPNDAKPDDVST